MKNVTVCLNMIVKNEKHIIKRCLDSVKSYIDYWVISDTGSTDGTQSFIKEYFAAEGIPGELYEHDWKNFAHNRNMALEPAKGKADYIFFIDADDYLENSGGVNRFVNLKSDAYILNMRTDDMHYSNIKLVKSELPWVWRSILHEVLNCDEVFSTEKYHDDNIAICSTREGARGRNPDKYKEDAEILEDALREEPENSRYQFYLARSYYAYYDYGKALSAYKKRTLMGDWEEEVFFSLYKMGHCQQYLNYDAMEVVNSFVKSYQYLPKRLEGLYEAIKICRENKFYGLGYELGKQIEKVRLPYDSLFVDSSVYHWKFLDEYSVCAIESGNLNVARGIIAYLLNKKTTPETQKERLENNLKIATGF